MHLVWRAKARTDLRGIIGYIGDRNPAAARKLEQQISHAVDFLTINPLIHRPGRIDGTREAVVHPNYIVVYGIGDEKITILAVLHARQRYP